ncbi:MAG: VanZ family protein [Bryobacterales bacterium]|nr:VanZ family protein [Bryobacterales bacterium]
MTPPRLLWLYLLLVLYLCLYPWNFQPEPTSPLLGWHLPQGRSFYVDGILNLLLLLPLGFGGMVVLRTRWRWLLVPFAAFGLSAAVESMQAYLPTRDSSAWDVIYNTTGAVLGMALATILGLRVSPKARPNFSGEINFRVAALLSLFVVAQFFPFIPVLRMPHLRAAMLALPELPDAMTGLTAFTTFLIATALIGQLTNHPLKGGVATVALLGFLGARVVFPGGIHPGGAIAASAAGAFAGEYLPWRIVRQWLGPALLLYLAFRQLYPFQFVAEQQRFYWVPFDSVLQLKTEYGLRILLEKCFVYGSTVWLLSARVGNLALATAACAGVLALGEVAQVWIPGRTPDTLDPSLAILAGLALAAFPRAYRCKPL